MSEPGHWDFPGLRTSLIGDGEFPACRKTGDNVVRSVVITGASTGIGFILDGLTRANPKVRYQITPDPMQQLIVNMLPKRLIDRIIARRLGLMPQA